MSQNLNAIVALASRPSVTEADVRALRRDVLKGGFVSREQAEALLALDAAANEKCEAWTELFVEAITDHVVWQVRPTGIVSPDKAEWLLACIDRAQTPTRLAALVNILAEAHQAPVWFVSAVRGRAATWPGLEALAARLAA
ncbi:MAG: hypothetical protein K2X62_15290 [Beijerinckiaceae bacterium]|nr:hypothetical protein [Beijerinckiaceae bacterium]